MLTRTLLSHLCHGLTPTVTPKDTFTLSFLYIISCVFYCVPVSTLFLSQYNFLGSMKIKFVFVVLGIQPKGLK
jgi:hypothetical protein